MEVKKIIWCKQNKHTQMFCSIQNIDISNKNGPKNVKLCNYKGNGAETNDVSGTKLKSILAIR